MGIGITPPGSRVLAIRSANADIKTVYVFGSGVYVGDERPPNGTRSWLGVIEADFPSDYTNPRIDLDRGGTIWGCQCWWGSEARMREKFKGFTFVDVPLPDVEDVPG